MPTTIHPFPELRKLAEQYAQERADERARYGYTHDTGGASWAVMGPVSRDIAVSVELTLLCDLSRPASWDAVCRLVAEHLGCSLCGLHAILAGEVEGFGVFGDELAAAIDGMVPAEALSMIVAHLWPSE